MQWLLVIACFTLLASSGCTTPAADDTTGDQGTDETTGNPPTEPFAIKFQATGCLMLEAVQRVDAEDLDDSGLIPDDFTVAVVGSEALMVLGTNRCQTENGTLHRTFLAFPVTPNHDSLLGDAGTNHFWEPEHIVENDTAFHQLMIDIGANVTVSDEMTTELNLISGTHSTTLPTGQHIIDAALAETNDQPGTAFGHFREYFPAQGGYGYFDATYGTGAGAYGSGTGTVSTAPDTPTHTMFADKPQAGMLSGNGFTFEDATAGFVPKPTD